MSGQRPSGYGSVNGPRLSVEDFENVTSHEPSMADLIAEHKLIVYHQDGKFIAAQRDEHYFGDGYIDCWIDFETMHESLDEAVRECVRKIEEEK